MGRNNKAILGLALLAGAACLAAGADGPAPSALLQESLASLRDSRFAQAEEQAVAAATSLKDPCPRAWLVAGAARERLGQYASAARAYRLFLAACDRDDSRQFVMDRLRACEAALTPAKPANAALTDEQKQEFAKVDEKTFVESSEHFIVHARNARLAAFLAADAEAALKRICGDILSGHEYAHSVEIHVWPDKRQYVANAPGGGDSSGGKFTFTTQNGETTRRIDLTQTDESGAFASLMPRRVLPHELCHLVIKEFFGDAACPLFLDEGLAMMAEEGMDNSRIELAGAALAGRDKITADQLFSRQQYNVDDAPVFYAEAYSFTRFIRSRMSDRQFQRFLGHVKDGCPVTDAIQRAVYSAPDEGFAAALASAWEEQALADAQILKALKSAGADR